MRIWHEKGQKIGIKDEEEIRKMRESGRILGKILKEMEIMIAPGVTGLELDSKAEHMMKEHGVKGSFKGFNGFPNVLCININEQVVHGIPSDRVFKEGDIVTVDAGVIFEGFHSDSAIQKGVGIIDETSLKLLRTAQKALDKAIAAVKPQVRIRTLSGIIEDIVTENGFFIVKDLVGHGIGTELHEDPPVPNFRDELGPMLQPGMTIAIEPIIGVGTGEIKLMKDEWTYVTADGSRATQVEHTILVTKKGAEILTTRPD